MEVSFFNLLLYGCDAMKALQKSLDGCYAVCREREVRYDDIDIEKHLLYVL